LAKALRKGKVKVVTGGVPAEVLQKFFVVPCETVEAAVAEALEEYGADATIAVIPEGPSVLAVAKHKIEVKKEVVVEEVVVEKEPVEPAKEEEVETTETKKGTKKGTKKAAVKKTETKKAAKKATKKVAAKEEE